MIIWSSCEHRSLTGSNIRSQDNLQEQERFVWCTATPELSVTTTTPSWRHKLGGDTAEKTLPSKCDRRAVAPGAHSNRTSLCQEEAPELTGLTWPTLTGLSAFHFWGLRMFFQASKALVSAFSACFCHIPHCNQFVKAHKVSNAEKVFTADINWLVGLEKKGAFDPTAHYRSLICAP